MIALPAVLHSPALLLPLVGRGADVAAISTRAFARQGLQVQPLAAEPRSAPPIATVWPCAKRPPRCCIGCSGVRMYYSE